VCGRQARPGVWDACMPSQCVMATIYFFGFDSDGRRAPTSTYVLPTGREDDPEWKKWNPHGSWHRDGRLHHKSFNKRLLPAEPRQEPNAEFKGTHQLIMRGIALDEPRAFGVTCDPTEFSDVVEIPVGILSPKHYETYTSIDVSEPGLQPLLMGGTEEILAQRIFDDAIPHITVSVYRWALAR
jgi:hypothetical protein